MAGTKKRRFRDLIRRIGAGALSLALGVTMMAGTLPLTAYAADVDSLTIQLRDRELMKAGLGGADAQGLGRLESRQILYHDVTEFYKLIPVSKFYVTNRAAETLSDGTVVYTYTSKQTGNVLSFSDCWTPDQNGKYRPVTQVEFEKGMVACYEEIVEYEHWSTSDTRDGSTHSYGACFIKVDADGDGIRDSWQWSAHCIENHASGGSSINSRELPIGSNHTAGGTELVYPGRNATANGPLESGHIYVITEGPNIAKSAYCYVPDVYSDNDGFYETFRWGSSDAVFANEPQVDTREGVCVDGTAPNWRNLGKFTRIPTDPNEKDGLMDPLGASVKTPMLSNEIMRGGFYFSVHDAETGLASLQTMAMPSGSVFAVFNINGTAIATQDYKDLDQLGGVNNGNYPIPSVSRLGDGTNKRYGRVLIEHEWQGPTGKYDTEYYLANAYTYEQVMQAYESYLNASLRSSFDSNGTERDLDVLKHLPTGYTLQRYTGLYGYGDYQPLAGLYNSATSVTAGNTKPTELNARLDPKDVCSGLFDLSGKNDVNGIVPCAMLVTGDDGVVHTGAAAFPAGNYLVLQVRSPAGYYIDENFRLGVAIGPWHYDWDLDVTSTNPWNDGGGGYGNALFGQFSYTTRDTSYLCRSENHFSGSPLKNAYVTTKGYPSVYINAADKKAAVERPVSIESCSDFFVTSIGGVGMSLDEDENVTYREGDNANGAPSGLGNKGNYIFNNTMSGSSANKNAMVGVRRYPNVGDSRLEARLTPVRAGVSFRLADADKIAAYKSGKIKDMTEIWAPQGDASLEGAGFNLYHDAATGNESLGAYIENGRVVDGLVLFGRDKVNTHGFTSILGLANSYYGAMSLVNNHASGGWPDGPHKTYYSQPLKSGGYVVNVPVDEMPYGEYTFIQTGSGNGYGGDENWAAHLHEEISPNILRVIGEDHVFIGWGGKNYNSPLDASQIRDVLDKYTIGGQVYLPQSVYRSKADVSVSVRGDANNTSVTAHLKIYNISENGIVLNPGKAGELSVATAKKLYEVAGINGTVTMDVANSITSRSGWSNALVWEGDVKSASRVTDAILESLPYGTYLVVVTRASGDYAPVNGAMDFFTIRPGEPSSLAVILADKATIPQISGDLVDAANGTKTLRVDMDVTVTDTLELTNLQAGVPYVVYGALLDASNMMMIAGPVGTTVAAFVPDGYENSAGMKADSAILASWIATGTALNANGNDKYWDVVSGLATPFGEYKSWLENYTAWAKAVAAGSGGLHCSAADKAIVSDLAASLSDVRTMNASRHSDLMGKLKSLYNAADDSYLTGSDKAVLTFEHIDTRGMEGKMVTAVIFVCEGDQVDSKVLAAKDVPAMRAAMGDTIRAEHSGRSNRTVQAYSSYAVNVAETVTHAGAANYGTSTTMPVAHAYSGLLPVMLASSNTGSDVTDTGSGAGSGPVTDNDVDHGTGDTGSDSDTSTNPGGNVSAKTPSQEATVVSLKILAYGMPGGSTTKRITAGGYVAAQVDLAAAEVSGVYKIIGTLKDESGMAIAKSDGTALSVEKQFTFTGGTHSETLSFEGMDAGKYDGQRLTVYVDLYRISTTGDVDGTYFIVTKGDETKSTGNDPGMNQVDVKGPSVSTVLTDTSGSKTADLKRSGAKLRDRVTYTGLTPGVRYESVLSLKYPNGNDVLDYNGKPVTATATFTARSSGSTQTDINVTFDGRSLTDKTVIAFNDLYVLGSGNSKTLVASEHDLEAADQTVKDEAPAGRIYIAGEVKDDVTGTHYTYHSASVKATDTITIQGLDAGVTYTLKVTVADAGNRTEIDKIPAVTNSITANDSGNWSGSVGLNLNMSTLAGHSLVVYLRLYSSDGVNLIAEHVAVNDENQTLYVPGVDTYATWTDGVSKTAYLTQLTETKVNEDGSSTTEPIDSYTTDIRDQVNYKNLEPGNQYELVTTIKLKSGGDVTGADGQAATKTTKFTPSSSSGTMSVDMTIDATKITGQDVVVCQTIRDVYTSQQVLAHDGLDDNNQTVRIGMPGQTAPTGTGTTGTGDPTTGTGGNPTTGSGANTGKNIQTGVAEYYTVFIAAGVVSVLAAAGFVGYIIFKKKKEQAE